MDKETIIFKIRKTNITGIMVMVSHELEYLRLKKMFPNFFKEHTYDQHSIVSACHLFFDYSESPVKN